MQHKQTIVGLTSLFFGAKLQGLCEQEGYEYKGAIGVSSAVKRIQQHAPSAIFLDLSKDDIDVHDCVVKMKAISDVPIIAFCGHVATEKLEEAKQVGCDVVTTNGALTNSFASILKRAVTS